MVGRRRVANKPDFQRRDLHTATLASCNTRFYGVMAFLQRFSTIHDGLSGSDGEGETW